MIKKIDIAQLIPGMYIHDLNCGWMDHPFATNRFIVKDETVALELRGIGVKE